MLRSQAQRPAEAEWPPGTRLVRFAWSHLESERQWGAMGGASRLSWCAYERWAERYGVVGEEFDWLWRDLSALDSEFIEHLIRVAESKVNGSKT